MKVTKTSDLGQTGRRTKAESADRAHRWKLTRVVVLGTAAVIVLVVAAAAWLGSRASVIRTQLEASNQLIPVLKQDIEANKQREATAVVGQLRSHTAAAREAAADPLWTLASAVPVIGANFSAVAEVARSADDVATLGVAPLISVFASLKWDTLFPNGGRTDLSPLRDASPSVAAAAHAVGASAERLRGVDASVLWPQVAEPLIQVREQLQTVKGALDASASVANIAPNMLGADRPRSYLLMIQNNAESRATGGIPGALAVLTLDNGRLTMGAQSSAAEVGSFSPPLAVDPEQREIYSSRLGMYIQDVNLTPDFPTSAATSQAMWEKKTGQRVDGVVSLDPVALSYILDATGPVQLSGPEVRLIEGTGLPTQLTGQNVVPTLLSDVYAKIPNPKYQDDYFAGVAKEIFNALSTSGKGDPKKLIESIGRGAAERRILLWSTDAKEQAVINTYPLSGSISGPSIEPAQFGVYFNDGTGAKMDYYVKRTVQLIKQCTTDGYQRVDVRVTSTNTAPADAASSLPPYVTGGSDLGIPAGTTQTNVVAYGPALADLETASLDGHKTAFAAQRHGNRPVGTLTVTLAPGQSTTLSFSFGRIPQQAEPTVVVTPTVQHAGDVVHATPPAECTPQMSSK